MARKEWNHHPDVLPLGVNPLWSWPPRPRAVFEWYWSAWLPVSQNLAFVALACFVYLAASPTLEQTATPGAWIALIWVRNATLLIVLAHGLHLIFHRHQLQGVDHKYDPRPFPRAGRMFTFGHQMRDNIFWSIASGVTIWTLYEALIWWSYANGYAALWFWSDGPIWFIAFFLLVPIWESFYFYWIHRVLHSRQLYRFHALHHRNTDVGPWSGLSMHPVEHLFYFGTAFIHFVVPSHPIHMIFHLLFYALYAVTTHTGFEGFWASGRKRLDLGKFHHQMHHRYFEVNYGTLEVPWDKFFRTFHDGSDEAGQRMRQRLKDRAAVRK
jgi:lathosterol oxidase